MDELGVETAVSRESISYRIFETATLRLHFDNTEAKFSSVLDTIYLILEDVGFLAIAPMVHPHLPYYGSQFLRFAFVTSDMLFGCVVFVVQLFTVALFLHSGIKVNASNAIDNSSSISTSWKGVSNRYSLPTFLLRQLLLVQTRFLFTPVCVRLFVMLGGYFSPKVEFVDFSHETFSENTLLLKLLFPVICLPMLLAISFVCILATIRPEPGFRKAPSTRMHNRFDFFYILLRMVAIGCLTFAAREISIIVIPIVCACIFVLFVRFQPFFWPVYNYLRGCILGAAMMVSFFAAVLKGMEFPQHVFPIIWVACDVSGGALGFLAVRYSQQLFLNIFIKNIKNSQRIQAEFLAANYGPSLEKDKTVTMPSGLQVNVFYLWSDAELLARNIALKQLASPKTPISEEDIHLLIACFEHGCREYPDHAGPLLHQLKYLKNLHLAGPQTIWRLITKANLLRPLIDIKVLLKADAENLRFNGGEIAYEYDRFFQNALTLHGKAGDAVVSCWEFVLNHPDKLFMLPQYADKLVKAIQEATDAYKATIRRWPLSAEATAAFAKFLATVRNDNVRSTSLIEDFASDIESELDLNDRKSGIVSNRSGGPRHRHGVSHGGNAAKGRHHTRGSIHAGSRAGSVISYSRKKKTVANNAAALRKELDTQLRWNLEFFATSLKAASVMVVILLVVNLVFLLLLRSLHMRHLETEWEICNVSVNSVNVFMGLRKLETFSRNTSSLSEEFLYNNFRMHLATASSAGFRATKSLWMKAIDEGGEKLNMLQDPTLVIRQIFPYRVMPQNASLTSIPLMVSILRGFSGSGVISDYNLIDQISHAKGSSFYDRTRFILDNFLGTSYDEGHVKPSMFDSWRSIDIVAKNDLLSIVYVLIFVTLIVLIYFAFALIQNGLAKLIEQQQNALNVFKCIPKLYVDQMLTVARNAAASVKQQQIGDMASDIVSPFAIQQQQQRPVEGLQVEDVAGVENNVGATNSEDLKKKKITKAKSDERIAGGRNDTAMPIRAVNPDISVSEKSWSKRYLSSERRRMWGIVVFDAVVQFIIFILILVYTNLFSVDHTRLKSLCTLHQNAVRTSALAMETKNVDYQLWDENEVLSTALAESTNMFEASTTLFLNTWLYVRGDVEVLVKGGQGVDACLSYNTSLCTYRLNDEPNSPETFATRKGLEYLLGEVVVKLRELHYHFNAGDEARMSPIHDFFQDVAVNELMDGLTELRYRAYESSQKRTLDYLRAVVGVWSVGCVCAMSSFFVIKASVNAIQATFSRTWELLSLVPDEVHSKIPDMGKFIADLTFETTSKRGALAIFFSYLVGKGSTQTVTPGAASSDPIVSTVPGSTESVPSTSGGLTDGIQRPLSGLALWIRKELYRDLYPDSMGEASKHRIYYMRRRLSAVRVGSLHAWALAVAVVITGEMSGWNISVARGGFGSLLVATVVGFINYSSVAFATAELQEENPTAVGSIVAYVRNNNLSPFLGYVGGNFLNFEYILFISLIISSISGYLWGMLNTSASMQVLYIFVIVAILFLIIYYLERHLWKVLVIGVVLSILIILGYSALGAAFFKVDLLFKWDPLPDPSGLWEKWFPTGYTGVLLGIMPGYWWWTGLECIPNITQELAEPKKSVRNGLISSLITLTCLALLFTFLAVGVEPGMYQIGQSAVPSVSTVVALFGESSRNWALLALFPCSLVNLVALVMTSGRMTWSLSLAGLYPQWMSVTSWENEKEGRPPLRCYMVNISIATVLALTMVLQAVISPNSPPVTSILLFATILSAICYYICLGIVQIAYAAKPPSPRLGEVTSWKRSMGILRGVVLVVMNVAVIGAELALDPVFRTGAVVLSCIMALSCLYYFAYSKKTIVPVQF